MKTPMLHLWLLAAACELASCGGGGDQMGNCDDVPSFSSSPFVTGVKSSTGNLTLSINSTPTSPPRRGYGSLEYLITDSSGEPVDGLTLEVVPWMVQMGHPSSINTCVRPQGKGVYIVNDVYLIMPGEWSFQTTVTGKASDSFAPTVQVGD